MLMKKVFPTGLILNLKDISAESFLQVCPDESKYCVGSDLSLTESMAYFGNRLQFTGSLRYLAQVKQILNSGEGTVAT